MTDAARTFPAEAVAAALGCVVRVVQSRAQREGWPFVERPVRGGRKRFYPLDGLPAAVRAALAGDGAAAPAAPRDAVGPADRTGAPAAESAPVPPAAGEPPVRPLTCLPAAPAAAPVKSAAARPAPTVPGVTDRRRYEAKERLRILDEFAKFERENRNADASVKGCARVFVDRWQQANPRGCRLSVRTLLRWRDAHKSRGSEGLLSRYDNCGRKPTDWPAEAEFYLRACWLRDARPGMALAIRELRVKAAREGWPLPSDRTLQRFLRAIPRYQVAKEREGEAAARACLPYVERRYDDLNVNDVWIADHEVFDCWVLWPNGQVARPWATAYIDAASRRITGRCITAMPSSDTITVAFARGCRANGVPLAVYQDNGPDYSSKRISGGIPRFRVRKTDDEMRGMYELLSVRCHFAIPGNPGAKPVERWFRTQRDTFERGLLKGYCGNSPANRPDSAEDARKCGDVLPLADFEVLFERWIEEVYHQAPHTGHGMNGRSPNQVWNAKLPAAQIRAASPQTLSLLMGQAKPVKVTRQGVRVEKCHFWSEALVKAADIGTPVVVRYDRGDLGEVHVFDPAGRWLAAAAPVERTSYFDTEAPEQIGHKRKFVRELHADELDATRDVARGLDQAEMTLVHTGPSVAAERPQVLTPLRTPLDPIAREAAQAAAERKVERAQRTTALAQERAKRQAALERRVVEEDAALHEAPRKPKRFGWDSVAKAMGTA